MARLSDIEPVHARAGKLPANASEVDERSSNARHFVKKNRFERIMTSEAMSSIMHEKKNHFSGESGVRKSAGKSLRLPAPAHEKQQYYHFPGRPPSIFCFGADRIANSGGSGRMLVRGGLAVFPQKNGCVHRHSEVSPLAELLLIENRSLWIHNYEF